MVQSRNSFQLSISRLPGVSLSASRKGIGVSSASSAAASEGKSASSEIDEANFSRSRRDVDRIILLYPGILEHAAGATSLAPSLARQVAPSYSPFMNPKQRAAEAAMVFVKSGMVVGLGTGTTADFFLVALGNAIKAGKLTDVRGIPTSKQSD